MAKTTATFDANSTAGKAIASAQKVTTKPKAADLDKGQVVSFTDSKGKTIYYTKSMDGKLVKSNDPAKMAGKLNDYFSAVEGLQVDDLKDAQSREINELTQVLQSVGYSDKQIKSIVEAEKAKNAEEVASLNQVFAGDGIQYARRDATGNFVPNVNTKGESIKPNTRLTSSLAYNDPRLAPVVKENTDKANTFVNEFLKDFNITGDITKSGPVKIGMNDQSVYKAYDKGYLNVDPETGKYFLDDTVNVPDYSKVDQKFVTEFAKQAPKNPNVATIGNGTGNPLGVINKTVEAAPQNKYVTANLLANPEGITYTSAGAIDPKTGKPAAGQSFTISAEDIKNTWAYNPDDGLYYPPGTAFNQSVVNLTNWDSGKLIEVGGKGFQRQLTDVLSRGTTVGDKAYTTTKLNKKTGVEETYITKPDGTLLKGSKPLVDTGETDWNGNKIYKQTTKKDTKYNKVTIDSLYMQDKDTGDIVYLGSPGMGYLHIKKPSGGLFGGGFGGMVGNFLGGLALSTVLGPGGFGLSSSLANIASSAVMSAINGGDFGDIMKGALTTAFASSLGDGFSTGTMDASTTAGAINSVADDIASSIKNVVGSIDVSDIKAINDMAKNLVTNTIATGGDFDRAVQLTVGNTAASVVGNQIMQTTGDKNLANSAASTIINGITSGDIKTGLISGAGTYAGGTVKDVTGSNVAGNVAGNVVGSALSGRDFKDSLMNAFVNAGTREVGDLMRSDRDQNTGTDSNTGSDFTNRLVQGGAGLLGNYLRNQINSGGLPSYREPPTYGSALAPTTGTAPAGTNVLGGLNAVKPTTTPPAQTTAGVDVSKLKPFTGTLPPSLTSQVTPTQPTGALPTTQPVTQPTGALPTTNVATAMTPNPLPTQPTVPTIDVSKLKPITDLSMLPEAFRNKQTTTAPLSQPV